jgi:hypothetical protein
MTTIDAPAGRANHFLEDHMYRDSWSHLNRHQRIELREEYKFLRRIGVNRWTAKGIIYRVVNVTKGWDD